MSANLFTLLAYLLEAVALVASVILCLRRQLTRNVPVLLVFAAFTALSVYITIQNQPLTGICLSIFALVLLIVFITRFNKTIERQTDKAHTELMTRHVAEVQAIYQEMRGWRHDYHNHLQAIKGHMALGQTAELEQYLAKLEMDLNSVDTILKSGNPMLDAILNSKVSWAKSRKITVNAKALVPEKLAVSEIDLCVILGNLLDNAAEACLKLETESDRFIRVYIGVLKRQLYISVSNSVGGAVNKVSGEYLTTKGKSHGHGIKRVNALVHRYSGYVNRQNEPGVFVTEILLPL